MILAGVRDYMHWWQPLLLLAYVVFWLLAGPYFTQRALRRVDGLPRSRSRLGRCAKVNFLAGGTGLAAAMILGGFFLALAIRWKARTVVLGAVILGPPAMLAMVWAVQSVMLEQPAGTLFKSALRATVPLLVAIAVLGSAAFLPAWYIRHTFAQRAACHRHMVSIRDALATWSRVRPGREPPTLQALVDAGLLKKPSTRCPQRRARDIGYLYVPSLRVPPNSNKVRCCDRAGNHGNVRLVLFNDDRILPVTEDDFARLLALPENAALRELDQADQ